MSEHSPKYIVLVLDGAADYPVSELGGKTPLQVARTPNIDFLSSRASIYGMVKTIPEGLEPGSDVANLSILGYDPRTYFTGRGPFEAASMGVELKEGEVAFRCNLITIRDGLIADYSASHISNEEAAELIRYVQSQLGSETRKFYSGLSYRHLMVASDMEVGNMKTFPPHNIIGKHFEDYLPTGERSAALRDVIVFSMKILERHPVNAARAASGKNPANSIWLWGQGTSPSLAKYTERFGIEGGVISAVDLIKGIGKVAGLEILAVPGATGYFDTNYEAKARYALACLEKKNFVFIHVESPDEAGHIGDLEKKIGAIEDIDSRLLSILLEGLYEFEDFNVLGLPDHATPLSKKTHVSDPVPFFIYRRSARGGEGGGNFDELEAAKSGIFVQNGFDLMDIFLGVKEVATDKG